MQTWDEYFLQMAKMASTRSKDPSTQCGAVITKGKFDISTGYNGFPVGIEDLPERYADRELKYKLVIHAEVNAILRAKEDLTGCTMYVYPMPPCSRCACNIVQVGIKRVVTIPPTPDQLSRWMDDFKVMELLFNESGVSLEYLPCTD